MNTVVAAPNYWWEVACNVSGAGGYVHYEKFSGAPTRVDLRVGVYDSAADGHHARARVMTKNASGDISYYPWRKDLDGANNGWIAADTYASNSSGIKDVGVQVGKYEGDEPLALCTDWTEIHYS
ncbi:hypothetical protein [Streptomyces rubiginosohelvolus]|uniref:hypothetical protein n=1 Tax=Streptomyces rubiginosohelvolus TaxID=67362 RepID=UPI0037AF5F10